MRLFRGRHNRKHENHVFELPIGTLARKTLYDSMIGDPEELAELLGFPPISDDVAEMERAASNARLDRVSQLTPVLLMQAQIIAEASAEFQRNAAPNQYADELVQAIKTAYCAVAFAASRAAITSLIDFDVIHLAGD